MSAQPRLEHLDSQSYVAIPATVTMQELAGAVDRLFPELFGWLGAREVTPSDAPFIRYLQIDMEHELEIEIGAPVAAAVEADDAVRAGTLPAGRYVTLLHQGPYDGLVAANAHLQRWAQDQGIHWQMEDGSRWGARIERYLTDPSREPDPTRWWTQLAYLIA